jgi:hypothetical protein
MFSKVKEQQPNVMAKVTAVRGDVTLPQLGLSPSDLQQLLIENVSVVFHSAATIRFNEELKTALVMNVKGPMEMLEICRKMKLLEVGNFAAIVIIGNYQLILYISFRHLYTYQLLSTILTGRQLRKRSTTIRK